MKKLPTTTQCAIAMIAVLTLGAVGRAEGPLPANITDQIPWTLTTSGSAPPNNADEDPLEWCTQCDPHGGFCSGGNCGYPHREPSRFQLTEFNIYPTFSYLRDQSATYTEFEFASRTDLGVLEMENRTVLNVADLPSTIKLGPTNPSAQPLGPPAGARANGFATSYRGSFSRAPDHTSSRRTWASDPC